MSVCFQQRTFMNQQTHARRQALLIRWWAGASPPQRCPRHLLGRRRCQLNIVHCHQCKLQSEVQATGRVITSYFLSLLQQQVTKPVGFQAIQKSKLDRAARCALVAADSQAINERTSARTCTQPEQQNGINGHTIGILHHPSLLMPILDARQHMTIGCTSCPAA